MIALAECAGGEVPLGMFKIAVDHAKTCGHNERTLLFHSCVKGLTGLQAFWCQACAANCDPVIQAGILRCPKCKKSGTLVICVPED